MARRRTRIYDTLLVPDRGDGLRGSWGVFRPATRRAAAEARQAVTHVQVQERLRGATLVACELETGRQHQIRIHLAEAGHPLVGETVYVRDFADPGLPAPRPDAPRRGARLRPSRGPARTCASRSRRRRTSRRSWSGCAGNRPTT